MRNPRLFRNALSIIEPWKHVGYNQQMEEVRASVNVAYLAQKIGDCDSIVFPMWSSELIDLEAMVFIISSGIAIVMEGGDPVYETYSPKTNQARYLQDHYMANNPNPLGEKDTLDKAGDGSNYSEIHESYHYLFRNLIKRYGYYDLFPIDAKTDENNLVSNTTSKINFDKEFSNNSSIEEVIK